LKLNGEIDIANIITNMRANKAKQELLDIDSEESECCHHHPVAASENIVEDPEQQKSKAPPWKTPIEEIKNEEERLKEI
jgi:hypothetical protein